MGNLEKHKVIKVAENDNVGIVAKLGGIKKGTVVYNGIFAQEDIPMGHKMALKNIDKGENILRYNQTIGIAKKRLRQGDWVNENNTIEPLPPALDEISIQENVVKKMEPLHGYTFMGFRNKDGSVGTKNVLALAASVQCVAGFSNLLVKRIKEEILPKYPNVDDVVALNHSYGCGIAINAPAAVVPIRTLQNIVRNPNFGNEVLVVGLGCEKLRPETILLEKESHFSAESNNPDESIVYMQDESVSGYKALESQVLKLAEVKLKKLNQRKRVECPASDLVVGMQCGGSDAFSGITANPVVGFASDLIVRAGGSVMFSEVSEVRDAVHLLLPRTSTEQVGKALLDQMKWYDAYLEKGEVNRNANTTPGNKKGGLSNIVEKALGSIAKSGASPIVDVIGPGEKIRKRGLTFAATPASDFICGTLQLAAGMNVHVFTTGRGTPYGLAMVPVLKIASNSFLSKRWPDLIDMDAGQIANGLKTIEEMGWELFHLILKVASGEETVACDKLGLHNDLVLFNPGPVT